MALNEVQTGITDQTGGFSSILNGITRTDDALKKLERSGKNSFKAMRDLSGMVGQFTGLSIGAGALGGALVNAAKEQGLGEGEGPLATAGAVGGGSIGAIAGGIIGGAIGTAIAPGIGTTIGAYLGTAVGAAAGSIGGNALGNLIDNDEQRLIDRIFPQFAGTSLTADSLKPVSVAGYKKTLSGGDRYFDQRYAKPNLGGQTSREREDAMEIGRMNYNASQEVQILKQRVEAQSQIITRMSRR